MAHANQERWASLVDAKLRNTLVTRDNLIFNSRYEGDPTSGKVKIPVRDTEVSVKEYNKATGVDAEVGTTTYLDLNIDHDEAVNELIDGYDAASVPDDIVADRLGSAGYSLALSVDKKSIDALEGAVGATISATKTAATETNAYKLALEAKRVLGRKGVPNEGRFLIACAWQHRHSHGRRDDAGRQQHCGSGFQHGRPRRHCHQSGRRPHASGQHDPLEPRACRDP